MPSLKQLLTREPMNRERSTAFRAQGHVKFWWHDLHDTDYEPPIYALLSGAEWEVMRGWYEETEAAGAIGEINVPAMTMIQGLVMGNGIRRIVQLGHFYGYSTLLLGFMLRHMGARPGLFSVDIDQDATDFTQQWVDRGGLGDFVRLHVADSAGDQTVQAATDYLGGPPQLILLDSSHAYGHTLRELDLWVPKMQLGTIMLMHDTSVFAKSFDPTKEGGVARALDEWLPAHPEVNFLNLNAFVQDGADANELVYKDGCGLGMLQKVR